MKSIATAILVLLFATAGARASETQAQSMSFEECLVHIRQMAEKLQVAPINVMETSIARMVRFPASDGSVLVVCSKPDHKMVVILDN